MSFINAIFGYPLGWIMWVIYHIVPVYGLALILFTLVTKLAMVPLAIKQQKSMAKQTAFSPRLQEIQNKYKNNKEKMNEEMMKLYQEEGYNPMSGCLPMLIQFPILFGLIDVIYNPLKHIMRFSSNLIDSAMEIVTSLGLTGSLYSREITVINAVKQNPDAFMSLGSDFVQKIQDFNFVFLGIDLSEVPTMAPNVMILIPLLSGLTSILISLQSIRQQKQTMGENAAGSGMTKGMMLFMPIMSLVIAFQVPAGVGMYWIFTNVFSWVQAMLLNKYYNPKEMAEKAIAEAEARREEARRQKMEAKARLRESMSEAERIKFDEQEKAKKEKNRAKREAAEAAAAAKAAQVDEELLQKALSEKEKNRRKLAEARRRDAEKYGEEYVEVTDEDLDEDLK
ncbi:MAG: YidC/Oxa1 family membrane protein insertase [Provencibacterium sp.]|nr:YidC/Oxa1 family membrane protein insertase [Provencibacterium sp.]